MEEVKSALDALAELHVDKTLVEGAYLLRTSGVWEKVKEQEEVMEAAKATIELLIEEAKEAAPVEFDELEDVDRQIKIAESRLKSLCHRIPAKKLRKAMKLKSGRVNVTVSKATIAVIYDDAALLDAMPDLADMSLDGENLVERKVNPILLERMVSMKAIDDNDISPFREEQKTKAPSVRIKVEDE
jgi:hypothetical protein